MRQALRSRLSYLDRRLGADLPDGSWANDFPGLLGRDTEGSPEKQPQVEVMTPERLMNALRQSPQEVLDRFSLFIIDEAHLISQKGGRGLLLEGLLTILDASDSRLILLSGVIGNAASLAAWTSDGGEDTLFTDAWRAPRRLHILTSTVKIKDSRTVIQGRRGATKTRYELSGQLAVRPTRATKRHLATSSDHPVGHLVLNENKERIPADSTPAYVVTARTATRLLRAGSLLMVVSFRATARDAAKVIAAEMEIDPRSLGLADSLAARLGGDHPLVGCVRKGVAYHHAGLPVEVQEAVEDAVRSETLKAVVATSTLTDGVNLPVRTVVIATTEYANQDPGQRMSPAQLLNAVGRAGRAGKESEGWVVLALSKALQDTDFDRLMPSPSDLEVRSTLTSEEALAQLTEAETLISETQDAVLRLPIDSAAGGFVNYVWFILHALDHVPHISNARNWRTVVTRLFAFTQLPDNLKARWLTIADAVAVSYELTPPESRRRWAQAGTSLKSAKVIESIATALADQVELVEDPQDLMLYETLDVLKEQDVYSKLLELPERGKVWKFRRSARGKAIQVDVDAVVRNWIAGRELNDLAISHLSDVPDPAYRLEQMVDAVSEGLQHYLSWTVGLVVAQANEILLSRFTLGELYPGTAAHVRYGVDTPTAIDLLIHDVKSRRLAHDIGKIAQDRDLDEESLRTYLSELHIRGWRDELGATPTDVLDLLQYLRGGDRHKLGELMATGSTTAEVRYTRRILVDERDVEPLGVTLVSAFDGDEIQVMTENQTLLGVIVARDHASVAAVLESGLPLEHSLERTSVTISRAGTDPLSFT